MIPLQKLLKAGQNRYQNLELRYIHPSLYVICLDPQFEGLDPDARRALFTNNLGLPPEDVNEALSAAEVMLHLVTAAERVSELAFIDSSPPSHHWIEYLAGINSNHHLQVRSGPPIIHFYGYKGGQARTTVLAMLSKSLAEDGYKTLVVDADLEAPTLHSFFESKVTKLDSTLLGCIHHRLNAVPQPVYVPRASGSQGRVDLIACRPAGPEYDLDLATFTLQTSLNPNLIQTGFCRLLESCSTYDAILVDHRSGLSSTVLPVIEALPGPVVVCLRLDEQSDEADAFFEVLFSRNSDIPGVFLSFTLDPEDTAEKLIGKNSSRIDALLSTLGKAIQMGAQPSVANGAGELEDSPQPDELLGYWIPWFHDRSFLSKRSPTLDGISNDNRNSLLKMRELLGVQGSRKVRPPAGPLDSEMAKTPKLTNSGNTDQGLLIQTDALRKLLVPASPYTYVLGRKGTGKTRLLKSMVDRGLGAPLLVADDFPNPDAILSSDPLIKDTSDCFPLTEAEKFWWVLLDAVSRGTEKTAREALEDWVTRLRARGPSEVSVHQISQSIEIWDKPRVFLIDGVETAFNAGKMAAFVAGLFRFLGAIQSNSRLSQKLTVRLFIRPDLARRAVENVEQQIEGRTLTLSWDTQSILNFALARMYELEWFQKQFPTSMRRIQENLERFEDGAVPEVECNEYLLEVFPQKIRRNNLLTLTFLKDYFSEGQGESASFYPRIYDSFLRSIADPSLMGTPSARVPQMEDARVAQSLIILAHDYASKEYLKTVAAELSNLLQLADQPHENQARVDNLIEAFSGLSTPFELDRCVEDASAKLRTSFDIDHRAVRDALQQMKRIGIFEDRPGYAGWWRAGRLFKNALGMKYVR